MHLTTSISGSHSSSACSNIVKEQRVDGSESHDATEYYRSRQRPIIQTCVHFFPNERNTNECHNTAESSRREYRSNNEIRIPVTNHQTDPR